jgi:hypothetical protein
MMVDGTEEGQLKGPIDVLAPYTSVRNTSSKLAVNFVSLSRTRNLTARERSERTMLRLRACFT